MPNRHSSRAFPTQQHHHLKPLAHLHSVQKMARAMGILVRKQACQRLLMCMGTIGQTEPTCGATTEANKRSTCLRRKKRSYHRRKTLRKRAVMICEKVEPSAEGLNLRWQRRSVKALSENRATRAGKRPQRSSVACIDLPRGTLFTFAQEDIASIDNRAMETHHIHLPSISLITVGR